MNKHYPLHWWLVTLSVAPLHYALNLLFHDRFTWDIVMLAIPFSVAYSLPSLVIVFLAFQAFQKLTLPPIFLKALLLLIAIILTVIILWLIGGTMARDLSGVYITSLIFSAWIVRLQSHTRQAA